VRCPSPVKNRRQRYCSNTCQNASQRERYLERWLRGEESGNTGSGRNLQVSTIVKAHLLALACNKCSVCGWDKVHPVTKRVPLAIDHKDGNSRNSRPENLRVLCPNCHSLTETYGNLNRGNGRSLGL